MSLSKLPRDLILEVADQLPIASLSRLHRTCHSLHQLLGPVIGARITTQLASTILQWGIEHNMLPTVHLALAHNAAWHIWDEGPCYSALADACHRNHLDIIAALITHFGPTIVTNNQQPNGRYCHLNPLEAAIRTNNVAVTTLLLEGGAAANRTLWYGNRGNDKSPLGFASKYGSVEIVEVLLKYGAEVRYADRSLCYAVDSGRWDVARVLLREGVSVWESHFQWSDRCPLGERTPEEIERWVVGGEAYMLRCQEDDGK